MGQAQVVHLINGVIVLLVCELQRDKPGICQVRAVDAGIRFCHNCLYPQIQGNQGRVLPGRALPVVGTSNDNAALLRLAALGELFVAYPEAELGEIGDVGAVGEDFRACGHNVVGGDIVAHLQNGLFLDGILQRLCDGERLDVRPPLDFHRLHQGLLNGGDNHVVVNEEFFGHGDFFPAFQGAGICKHACEGRGCRRLRADQVNLPVRRTAAALEVAVEGAKGHARGVGGLAHAYAGAAGTLEYACPGGNHVGQSSVLGQHLVHLLRSAADGQAHLRVDGPALEYGGHAHHVKVGGVGAGADTALVYLHARKLRDRLHRVRAMGAGGQRLKGREVDGDNLVILRVRVRLKLHPLVLPALGL